MTRSEVRAFIQTGVDAIGTDLGFGSGLISDFNKERSNTYPTAWLEVLSSDSDITEQGLKMDSWPISLHIAKKDLIDSSPEQYEDIIDTCDLIAQKLINQYDSLLHESYPLVTITGFSRETFVKKHADVLSGVLLTFTILAPNTTDVC